MHPLDQASYRKTNARDHSQSQSDIEGFSQYEGRGNTWNSVEVGWIGFRSIRELWAASGLRGDKFGVGLMDSSPGAM